MLVKREQTSLNMFVLRSARFNFFLLILLIFLSELKWSFLNSFDKNHLYSPLKKSLKRKKTESVRDRFLWEIPVVLYNHSEHFSSSCFVIKFTLKFRKSRKCISPNSKQLKAKHIKSKLSEINFDCLTFEHELKSGLFFTPHSLASILIPGPFAVAALITKRNKKIIHI